MDRAIPTAITHASRTNFELGVHIPLIVRAPFMKNAVGQETAVLAEMVDIFPTLAALAGLPDPYTVPGADTINGTSLYSNRDPMLGSFLGGSTPPHPPPTTHHPPPTNHHPTRAV